jgi:ATP-dependent exoDNAse (exonuclease V) beta subunit
MKEFCHVDLPLVDDLTTEEIDGKRFYITPEGKKYPSVTTVTGCKKKEKILEWRQRVGEERANQISSRATRRGNEYHSLVEKYIRNQDISKSNPLTYELFKTTQVAIDRIDNIHLVEAPLYSDYLRLAGRVDCIAEFDGSLSVIDFKTSTKPKDEKWIEDYFVQETAYAGMFYERYRKKVEKIVTIIAVEDGGPQVFVKDNIDHYFTLLEEYIKTYHGING